MNRDIDMGLHGSLCFFADGRGEREKRCDGTERKGPRPNMLQQIH